MDCHWVLLWAVVKVNHLALLKVHQMVLGLAVETVQLMVQSKEPY